MTTATSDVLDDGAARVLAELREGRSRRGRAAIATAREDGARIGRPPCVWPHREDAIQLVHQWRGRGDSWAQIAERLEHVGICTPTGRGRWSAAQAWRVGRLIFTPSDQDICC